MQLHGGSPYGAPPLEIALLSSPAPGPRAHLLTIPGSADELQPSMWPQPANVAPAAAAPRVNYDDDAVAAAAGQEVERGGAGANRWPREETLALLKIRSEMDAAFRDATLKGPLWEDVSRKLGELGYRRSAKKCKEKFENVHKYYKRTRDGRTGRQDTKTYRFFAQLEALHSAAPAPSHAAAVFPAVPIPICSAAAVAVPAPFPMPIASRPPGLSLGPIQPTPISVAPPPPGATTTTDVTGAPAISFLTTSESEPDESDDGKTEDTDGGGERGVKRKRKGGPGGSRKLMALFEGLMKQMMEQQEAMQQRFLETIERQEEDRVVREEAWQRQEMARLNREQERLAQERAMAVSRDSAVISFIQTLSGQTIPQPAVAARPLTTVVMSPKQPTAPPPPPPPPPQQQSPPPPQNHHRRQNAHPIPHPPSMSTGPATAQEHHDEVVAVLGPATVASSRWPKAEIHALIQLRARLESRYQDAGPKSLLWQEISAGMQELGYNRSAKRCKEKWENINKYFKKAKESNKQRPEDSKTCPYFHELDALYRKKHLGSSSVPIREQQQGQEKILPNPTPQPLHSEAEGKDVNTNWGSSDNGGAPTQASNGEQTGMKKPEDVVKELYEKMDDPDGEDMDEDTGDGNDDYGNGDEEDGKMQYRVQFQRPNVGGGGGGGGNTAVTTTGSCSSFLTMV